MWIKELKQNASPDIKTFVLGNKLDLKDERVISTEKGMKVYTDYNLDLFMETSAKTGTNTEEVFVQAARLLYNDYIKYKIGNPLLGATSQKPEETNTKLKKNNKKGKGGCC